MTDQKNGKVTAEQAAAALSALEGDQSAAGNSKTNDSKSAAPAGGADSPKGGAAAADGGNAGGQPPDNAAKKGSGIERLLASRKSVTEENKRLKEELEILRGKPAEKSHAEGEETPPPQTKNEGKNKHVTIADLERMESVRQARDEDSRTRAELIAKYPKAAGIIGQVDEFLKVHPTLTDEAVIRLIDPSIITESSQETHGANAADGARTPAALRNEANLPKTQVERKQALLEAEARGELEDL